MAQIPAGALNISMLSPDQLAQLTAAPAPDRATPADEPTDDTLPGQQAVPEGAIPIRQLSPKALAALTKPEPMGGTEAAGRLFYKHLTFGTSPGASREKEEQAAREHPYLNIATAIPAFAAQTAALGPLATAGKAVEGAGMFARAARGLGTAADVALLPNMEARTALQSARTGVKLGGVYSAGEAAGSDLTNPDKTWGQTARDVGLAGVTGMIGGGTLGGVAHGLGRVAGAVANRAFPDLRGALEASRDPAAVGASDFMRMLGYDKYTLDDLRAVQAALNDPSQAHRFAGLNLIEALETQPLRADPTTGELTPGIRVSPNTRDFAQDMSHIQGEGRQQAIEAFVRRRAEMSSAIQGEIDALSGQNPATADTLNTALTSLTQGARGARETTELPSIIDEHFGSGVRESDDALNAARREAFDSRFNRLRNQPSVVTAELYDVAQHSPELRSAIDYAARRQAFQAALERAPANPSGAGAMPQYTRGVQPPPARETGAPAPGINILTPSSMLDIHHHLALRARDAVAKGEATTLRDVMAAKNAYADWLGRQMNRWPDLNKDYSLFMRALEARDHGANLSLTGSSRGDRESLNFLTQTVRDLNSATQRAQQAAQRVSGAQQRQAAGGRASAPRQTAVNRAVELEQAHQAILDEFRHAFGDRLRGQAEGVNPQSLVAQATSPAGQGRIRLALGQQEGESFINSVLGMEARRQAMSTPLNPTPQHPGPQFFNNMRHRPDVQEAYRAAYGDVLRNAFSGQRNEAAIRDVLSNPGVRHLTQVYGRDRGGEFINELLTQEARRQALATPLNPESGHPGVEFFNRVNAAGLQGPVEAYRAGRGEMMKAALETASNSTAAGVNSVVGKLLTQAGKRHILEVYGPAEGRKFIEQLYNKQLQGQFSKTLYGGPDTAYKLARNAKADAMMDAAHAIFHLRPFQLVEAAKKLGSARFTQAKADRANMLMSQQGPEGLSPIIDSLIASEKLRASGFPHVRNPLLRAIPAGALRF